MTAISEPTALRVGLVHNWPGARNSELDIILRIIPILKTLGHTGLIIDPMGQELDENGDRLAPVRAHDNFDLVLNLHYLNPKLLSGLSYVVNWNPLAYIIDNPITKQPLPIKQVNFVADSFRSHDRVLSAGSDLVDSYVSELRRNIEPKFLAPASLQFHTTISSPKTVQCTSASRDSARVFYIGVNWEKLSQSKEKKVRHDGLFETLDKSGEFVFYGLKQQYGIKLWEGIKNYKGELPFDGGKSIIEVSHFCGISLVLSSEQHRESGLVSTRVFQACAAGTIIISDRNSFLEKHFGDDIYFFDYGSNAETTAKNILNTVNQIKSNWQEALSKAKRCQERFSETFALENQLSLICNQAKHDIIGREQQRQRLMQNESITVFCDARYLSMDELQFAYEQFEKQCFPIFHVVLIHNAKYKEATMNWLRTTKRDAKTHLVESTQSLGSIIVNELPRCGSFIISYLRNTVWNKDHTLNLLLQLAEGGGIAYSPTFVKYQNLLSAHETSEFGIKGLDGGMLRVDENALQRFSSTSINNAHFLIRTSIVKENVTLQSRLPFFNVGAIFVIAYEHWLATSKLPVLSFAISAWWSAKQDYEGFAFNQYGLASASMSLYRDRNMFSVLYADINPHIAERTIAWELQQQQELARSDYSSEYELDVMKASLSGITEKFDSGDFSRQFSFLVYLKHLFRNKPYLLYAFEKLHGVLTKVLKI